MTTTKQATTQVYRVYIKATPQAVWDAITTPEWSHRYGYGGFIELDLRPGGAFRHLAPDEMKRTAEAMGSPSPDVLADGEVIEADPPRRLVQTWRMLMDPDTSAEGFSRLTYEIEEGLGGTRLTVTHDVEGMPLLAALVAGEQEGAGGGWAWVLSDLKTLLESGAPLTG